MSIEDPFSQAPKENGAEKIEESTSPRLEREQGPSNVVEAKTPDGKDVKVDIEEVMRRRGLNPSEFTITDDMRRKIKEGIEKGFTKLLFTPKADKTKSFIGTEMQEQPRIESATRLKLRQSAEEILRSAKESGSWVKVWTPKEDTKFIEGWIKTMEAMEEASREMPEETPPARVVIRNWGSEPKLGWEWTEEGRENLGVASSRKL